jgi:hypothetical protein
MVCVNSQLARSSCIMIDDYLDPGIHNAIANSGLAVLERDLPKLINMPPPKKPRNTAAGDLPGLLTNA